MSVSSTFRLRSQLFLFSNANIGGLLVALLGPILLFAGVIGPGWLGITAGLYLIGAIAGSMFRPAPEIERHFATTLGNAEILQQLDRLIADVAGELDADMRAHLASVRASIAEVLPRLAEHGETGNDAFTVRETVLRYLPETLANYVALPPVFRRTHVVRDGKTPRRLLAEQLDLLDRKMQEVVVNVASADMQALVANGEFLRAKFEPADFLAS